MKKLGLTHPIRIELENRLDRVPATFGHLGKSEEYRKNLGYISGTFQIIINENLNDEIRKDLRHETI